MMLDRMLGFVILGATKMAEEDPQDALDYASGLRRSVAETNEEQPEGASLGIGDIFLALATYLENGARYVIEQRQAEGQGE